MEKTSTPQPPKWPLRLLRLVIRRQYLEEIEGDMEEVFADNLEKYSVVKARRLYVWELFKLLRPILLRQWVATRKFSRLGVMANYFKVSWRGLLKNPVNSFINVFGLSVAIGGCIMAFGFARWTYSVDQFHVNKNEVFLVTFFADRDGVAQQYGRTPRPLGELMKHDFPQVKKVCRVEDRAVVVKYHHDVRQEQIRFVDPSFLEMLTFPLKWGVAQSLTDINSIILSEMTAEKYFGDQNPIGETLLVKFGNEREKEFKVTGVAREFPKALTIRFQFLVNIENMKEVDPQYDFHDWNSLMNATLIQVNSAADISVIATRMDEYRKLQNEAAGVDWALDKFGFEPLATLNERSGQIKDDISRDNSDNYKSVIFLTVLGLFLLALGCLNYINIAIVSAVKRLKEIGVRKTIGATRGVVVFQFLAENMVITSVALIVGVVIGGAVFIPGFEYLNSFSMGFKLTDPLLWVFLPAILVLTSIASGIYPAFYISRFQVVGILKGAAKFGNRNPLTRVFLTVQLILTCAFITSAVMFTKNSIYLANRSWGYDQRDVMYAGMPNQLAYEELQAIMDQNPNVVATSGAADHLGKVHTNAVIDIAGRKFEVERYNVAATYIKTMGLDLKEGRNFHDHDGTDRQAAIVNEKMVSHMGWIQPIGQTFKLDSIQMEVVGVVKDFHSYSFFRAVEPTVLLVADRSELRYLAVRVREGSKMETYEAMQEGWTKLFPDEPFNGGLQEDVWGDYYHEIEVHGIVWRVIATIAITMAAMGLYGLMSLNVAGRVREFSIRKVLGAGLFNLTNSVSRQYMLLLASAIAIGAPFSYWLINWFIEAAYTYHVPFGPSGVIIAVGILLAVVVLTLATQVQRVWRGSPVEGLKTE